MVMSEGLEGTAQIPSSFRAQTREPIYFFIVKTSHSQWRNLAYNGPNDQLAGWKLRVLCVCVYIHKKGPSKLLYENQDQCLLNQAKFPA